MKRVQIGLIAGLGVFVVICGVLIWQLFGAMSTRAEAEENSQSTLDQLQRHYKQKVFPTAENVKRIREDAESVSVWLGVASNLLHRGEIKVADQTPSGFKLQLQETVRALSSQPGQVGGKICAPNFYFGFEKYLGDSAVLPKDGQTATKLAVQLALIDKICRELVKAGAVQIDLVERDRFDDKQQEEVEEAPREERRNRRRNNRRNAAKAEEQPKAQELLELASKQTFTIGFQARPEAFVAALNSLARIEPFMAVSSVTMTAGSDPLQAYAQSLSAEDEARARGDGQETAVSKSGEVFRKIVTSPEMEAPLKIKIQIDVYKFEGV